jgi:hypothetical protein
MVNDSGSAAQRIDELRDELALKLTEIHLEAHPEFRERFGEAAFTNVWRMPTITCATSPKRCAQESLDCSPSTSGGPR